MTIDVKSNIGANVWKVLVTPGQTVEADQTLVILECMKMEVPVEAGQAGRVAEVLVKEGHAVDEGCVLIKIEVFT
jgi:acetyl-CoA carboxylase biotin carboxyl carrier protein